MNDISPEERLFKAIEEKDNDASREPKPKVEEAKEPKIPSLAIKWHKHVRNLLVDIYHSKKWPLYELNIEVVNKMLIVILVALAGFLVIDFVRLRPNLDKIYDKISALPTIPLRKKEITFLEPLSVYYNVSSKRDIFNPLGTVSVEKLETEKVTSLSDLVADLSLVGIYWGDVPEVMIEDTKEKKTYFLKRGQSIKGIRIDSILEDKIILEYNNEIMEFM